MTEAITTLVGNHFEEHKDFFLNQINIRLGSFLSYPKLTHQIFEV
jgi:hypothetical protein